MAMQYVDRPTDPTTFYYSEEDDRKVIELIAEWAPRRKQAIIDGDLHAAPIPAHVYQCIVTIAKNIVKRDCYREYWYRDDMVDDAAYAVARYVHNFDPTQIGEKSGKINFFSYITKSIDRAFGNFIDKEDEQDYFKAKSFENMGGIAAIEDEISEGHISVDVMDNTDIGRDVSTKTAKYENKRMDRRIRDRDRRKAKLKQTKKPTNGLARMFAQQKEERDENR
ncbi:late sigma transcription factor [Vibrio phage K469]